MRCHDIDMFKAQVRMEDPDEWFVLHMVGCKECRTLFAGLACAREALKELLQREEDTDLFLDKTPRGWMLWMGCEMWPDKDVGH